MAENNVVTKEDLQSALNELAVQLTKQLTAVIQATVRESAEATEAKLTAELDRRFDGVNKNFDGVNKNFDGVNKNFDGVNKNFDGVNKNFDGVNKRFDGVNKRFRRAERKQQTFQKEVENQFHQLRGMVENRFDMAKEYTDEQVVKEIRKVITMLDGQAGMTHDLKIEQDTLGVLQERLERNVEASNNANGAAIADLKQRVTVLEEKVLAEQAK